MHGAECPGCKKELMTYGEFFNVVFTLILNSIFSNLNNHNTNIL